MFTARRTWTDESTSTTVQVAFTDASVDVREGASCDPLRLEADLSRLEAAIGAGIARMHQVHGADVAHVRDAAGVPTADALTTDVPGLALMTRAADCVPVLLAAPREGMVGAVHAGREGVLRGVVHAAVEALRRRGATRLRAWVGPHVCGGCYEVPEEMRAQVAEAVPAAAAHTTWGTSSLDLGAGVRAQLDALDVEHEDVGGCTLEDDLLWSHRRQGAAAGRMAGLVWVAA
ncbi:polyphenol oxidase family protein [Nocardioides sp. Y6]|uniref:Polyphenol oxidase family protein n=1 Tax=Nocardioides malaquae TaxID=2773426 RepID=A0ABR9RNT3_9ACTN|nr:polyphenol oxidase family protein [Nocardioides malaquae]MBE7323221.1 polyphenol oxidase family protein [Nocardioides malaquae]